MLVGEVLKIANSFSQIADDKTKKTTRYQLPTIKILDLGTGSGCIAISIAKNLPTAKIFATDISSKALAVAQTNAKFHRVENQVFFLKSDLLSFMLPDSQNHNRHQIDIIAANLPYIPAARLMYIDPMVKDFEPRLALDGGRDGFELYRRLFQQLVWYSSSNNYQLAKYLIVEIDEAHSPTAKLEAKKYFPNAQVEIKMDLAKRDRILIIKF